MTQITVTSFNQLTPLWTFGGATCVLKLFYNKEFVDSDDNIILPSTLTNPAQAITCDISPGGVITIPEIDLTSTTDGSPNTSSLTGVFFDDDDIERMTFFAKYEIPYEITTTTWPAIFVYNDPSPVLPDTYYTRSETNVLINSAQTIIPVPSSSVAGNYALEFTAANESHVNHGLFWVPGQAYTTFYADALIKPTGGQYIVSAGYGGNHCLLWGVSGNEALGYTLSGNIYSSDTAIATSFQTTERIRHNEWAYVACCYDGARVGIFINGIPSAFTVYTGNRKTTSGIEGTLLVGGSDHQNYEGRLRGLRIFEGTLPYDNPFNVIMRPPVENFSNVSVLKGASTVVNAAFLADYSTGTLRDGSAGMSGAKHNGYLATSLPAITNLQGTINDPVSYNRTVAARPTWVVDAFSWPTVAAAQKTPAGAAKIFEDFSKPDVHYGNSTALGLGSTRIGDKTWSGANYGILNGAAFAYNTAPGATIITDTEVDGTIILKKVDNTNPTGLSVAHKIIFRYQDASNYHFLQTDEFGTGYLFQVVATVWTQLGANLAWGTNWTEAKIVLAGTSVEVFADGVSKGTRTMTQLLSATHKGFELNHPVLRVASFEVQ